MSTSFHFYLFLGRSFFGDDKLLARQLSILDQIITKADTLHVEIFGERRRISVERLSATPPEIKKILDRKRKFFRDLPSHLLHIGVSINDTDSITVEYDDGRTEVLTRDSDASSFDDYVFTEIENFVFRLLVTANIAIPGSMKIMDGVGYCAPEAQFYHDGLIHPIEDAMQTYDSGKFDFLENMDLDKVWKWINQFKSLESGLSATKVERALNAFAHLFISENGTVVEQIVWSVFGLEALFVKGNTGARSQLADKLSSVIGEKYYKQIKEAYDFRSRALHGDIELPFPTNIDHDVSPIEHYRDRFSKHSDHMILYLASSLQWLIRHEATDIDYETIPKFSVDPKPT